MFECIDLQAPCAYFGIQIEYLKTKLISKRLEFKEHSENKQVDQTFTVDKAIFTRDALAKAIYSRIFDYLIQVERRFSIEILISILFLFKRRSIQHFEYQHELIYPLAFLIFMVLKSLKRIVSNNFVLIMSTKSFNKYLLN